jgi:hypothetical protein
MVGWFKITEGDEMILPISAKFYVFLFIVMILLVPAFFCLPLMIVIPTLYWGLLIVNALVLVFVWFYTSSSRLSFPRGLELLIRPNMSGCANLTMIYLFPMLFMVYCIASFNAFAGLKKGKIYTERKWIEEVSKYEAIHQYR